VTHGERKGCSLNDTEVSAVLDRLHRDAGKDGRRFAKMGLSSLAGIFAGRGLPRLGGSAQEQACRLKDVYTSISPEQGLFAYLVARSIGAQRIVEFGASFGVSTIYLAAAVKDNGGGIVVSSEIEASKAAKAEANLHAAGLGAYANVRLGDAMETLAKVQGPVDMVLMDGWKGLYLPLIRTLTPSLCTGAVVLADDVNRFGKSLQPYVAHMRDPQNGFQSTTLPIGDGFEYSVKIQEALC
jgi:predicted O-methyltransferase YrrM